MNGKTMWVVADGFLPEKSSGLQQSHESICVINLTDQDAKINITVYFEDSDPVGGFCAECRAKRTSHVRLDRIANQFGQFIPRGVPYAITVESSVPVVVQHSRLDSSQEALALFTTIAYSG